MKKYTVVITKGTTLRKERHPKKDIWVLSTHLDSKMCGRTVEILRLNGRDLNDYDGSRHNGFSWMEIRSDLTLDDFYVLVDM